MTQFELKIPVKLYFGPGALDELPKAVAGLGKKALVVTGTSSARKTGVLTRVLELLKNHGIEGIPFEKATPNPLSTTVMEGVELVRAQGCEFIIGIGGGSPVDTAKAIALCAANDTQITDYHPGGKLADSNPQKALPIVAIATTAGTGTEINRFLVITNAQTQEKPGIGFDCTYPVAGIVDPEIMVSIPQGVTADTGVDVFYHAMEAYVSKGATLFTDMIALEAIRLTVQYLPKALADGSDLEARTEMAWASTMAGLAIDLAGTVTIHAMGHPVSGRLNKPHGQTLAAVSVAYMNHNYDANPEKFAHLAKLLGASSEGLSTEQLAAKAGSALKAFLQKVGRDITLRELGVTEDMIDQLADDTVKTMSGALESNPKPVSLDDVKQIYRDSL